jgi:hypothetical protein
MPTVNFGWAFNNGSPGSDNAHAVSADSAGNVYATGFFTNSVNFGLGYTLTSAGQGDAYVAKYNASGTLQWATDLGGTGDDQGLGITADGSGNTYVTGYFNGTATFGTFTLSSPQGPGIFVTKLGPTGSVLWATGVSCTGSFYNQGSAIALDGSGNVYVAGNFSGTATFGSFTLSTGYYDGFATKLNGSTGTVLWADDVAHSGYGSNANGIAVDGSGNAYLTGSFTGPADFDPGPGTYTLTSVALPKGTTGYSQDAFILKLDTNGNFVWAGDLGGNGSDAGNAVAVDGAGNLYVTGYYSATSPTKAGADFDPGPGTHILTSAGSDDVFVAKYDTNRNLVWARSMGGANYDTGNAIALDGSGNVWTTGKFSGTADFDPGAGTYNLTGSTSASSLFISELNAAGNFAWAGAVAVPATGEPGSDPGGVAVDASGDVYVSGEFAGTSNFNPAGGTYNLTSNGGYDFFVVKLTQGPAAAAPATPALPASGPAPVVADAGQGSGQAASAAATPSLSRGVAVAGTPQPFGTRQAQGDFRHEDLGSGEAADLLGSLLALWVRGGLPI